ncbi:hypothetical protein [Demequina aurantiaca]|uniref:hypothetical protein n=1 Tax=Demequina aurantiaca TaxID=676200 RepID=UPI003D357B1E
MLLVDADAVGPVEFSRLVRDGHVSAATRRFALPRDVVSTPGIRALCVSPSVPERTVLSGLAGLWVWHGGRWPGEVTVVGKRGLHRDAAGRREAGSDSVTFHSGIAWRDEPTVLGTVAIANPARCCSDALRWDAHAEAIPAIARVVARGFVRLASIEYEASRDNPRGAGYGRLSSLWQALRPALAELDASG